MAQSTKAAVIRARSDEPFMTYLHESYFNECEDILGDDNAFAMLHHCWLGALAHGRRLLT